MQHRTLFFVSLLAACAPRVAEPAREPVAVDVPSARKVADTTAPDRGTKSTGGFISGMAFKSAKVENARTRAQAVRMAAELQIATAASDKCPSTDELVRERKLDPKGKDDPWGNAYRIVCEEGEPHAISNGRDGIEGTADDVRDDASESDLKRIGDL